MSRTRGGVAGARGAGRGAGNIPVAEGLSPEATQDGQNDVSVFIIYRYDDEAAGSSRRFPGASPALPRRFARTSPSIARAFTVGTRLHLDGGRHTEESEPVGERPAHGVHEGEA